ncbi:cobalt ECF transporter T component CbiQ [Alkalihalobacillus sp. MEB130]|uniref:cobalt ECF transporter T component CbiQ n=1 Tax=Alkalihalobacillus sp. MEB130 TaxID=2976704 RepID=UPI0028E01F96|nr:cobalt ECF transporter T component CbiQ [Alkalihalobacillus sp. MEB130]MDT8861246.1 cobalt ECF transporter T component CbiQ [Alkalihalobacillus sp. MEB130]
MAETAEAKSTISNWALCWEPRAKLMAAILYIFGVISLSSPFVVFLAYMITVIALLMMGISVTLLVKRYLIILPFLLLMTIPLVFGHGFPISSDQVLFASVILLKAFTSMTLITIILETQSLEQFMTSLAHLKVPPVLITVLLLSYRYVFLFLDDIQKMQTAAKSRFFYGGIRLNQLKIYGQLTGCLLRKSLDRSDLVYEAMASRCFNGRLRFADPKAVKKIDIGKTVLAVSFIVILIGVENFYL